MKHARRELWGPLALFAILLTNCTSIPKPHGFGSPQLPSKNDLLWEKNLGGGPIEMSLSDDGQWIAVSSSSSFLELSNEGPDSTLSLFSSQGEKKWSRKFPVRIKSQSISAHGDLVAIATEDERLMVLDGEGNTLWSKEDSCRPEILSQRKRIFCAHDDDSEKDLAFKVYDWEGKGLMNYPGNRDLLFSKISGDEKSILLAFTSGLLVALNERFQKQWQFDLPGEIIDLDIGKEPKDAPFAILYVNSLSGKQKGQRLVTLNTRGKLAWAVSLDFRTQQIRHMKNASTLFAYGNSPQGQYLCAIDQGKVRWEKIDPYFADFSSRLVTKDEGILVGLEDLMNETDRHSHLYYLNKDGESSWDLPLENQERAYLFDSKENRIYLVTEEGILKAYSTLQ